jgi:MFS family permease
MVLANTSTHMYSTILPLYLKSLNASVVQVGLFFTLSQIFPLALQILGGWISDQLGRLRSVAIGSLAGVLGFVALILAPTWQWVLLSEAFSAMTRSLIGPSFGAFVAEQSTEENRARVFGISDAIFMIVGVIGPPLGGWLAGAYGFKIMLICSGVLYLSATLLRVWMARNVAPKSEGKPKKLSTKSLKVNLIAMFGLLIAGGVITWILITDGARDIAFTMTFTLMPLYFEEIGGLSVGQIGVVNAVFGAFMMLVTIPAGWLADKRSERLAIVLGFILEFVGLRFMLVSTTYFGFLASGAFLGIGVGLMSPAYNSLISKAVPEKMRGTFFGLFSTSLGLVSLPAPAIGAQLWERISPRFPLALTSWVVLISIIPAWLKFKLPDGQKAENAQTQESQ